MAVAGGRTPLEWGGRRPSRRWAPAAGSGPRQPREAGGRECQAWKEPLGQMLPDRSPCDHGHGRLARSGVAATSHMGPASTMG